MMGENKFSFIIPYETRSPSHACHISLEPTNRHTAGLTWALAQVTVTAQQPKKVKCYARQG